MKIAVNMLPEEDSNISRCFSTEATFESREDSTTSDCLNMFTMALRLEGYHECSIVHAMQEYINEAIENGIDLSIYNK